MKLSDEVLIREWERVFHLLHRQIDKAMTAQGASLARTRLLRYIQQGQGMARAADIADMFRQAPRTVTDALEALERDRLILRVVDEGDRRVKRIAITPEGERAIAATEPLRRAFVHNIFHLLEDEDRQNFLNCLQKIGATFDGTTPC